MTAVSSRSTRQGQGLSDDAVDSHQPDVTPDEVDDESSSDEALPGRKRPRDDKPLLARLVSQEAQYISENDEDSLSEGLKGSSVISKDEAERTPYESSHPNPLHDSKLLNAHIKALRIEADLFPMRQQVARLMAHSTHNRRGLFNSPVDHVALGLTDYTTIITRPLDLGTVKAKLHAVAYNNRDEVADDIRLVFTNAMTYSPPCNPVHIAAKHLLQSFEEAFQVMKASSSQVTFAETNSINSLSSSCLPNSEELRSVATRTVSMTDMTISAQVELRNGNVLSDPLPDSPPADCVSKSRDASLAVEQLINHNSEVSHNELERSGSVDDVFPSSQKRRRGNTTCDQRGSNKLLENLFAAPPQAEKALKRAMNVAAKHAKHSCRSCLGRVCAICEQGCLSHEPALLICTGSNCLGAKIRKGAVYYIAKDGTRQFCQRCYTNLQAVLPHTADQIESFGSSVRYKRDLLKRKNEEDVAETWLTCKICSNGVHKICSMHNEYVFRGNDYVCPSCTNQLQERGNLEQSVKGSSTGNDQYYSFVSGSEIPCKLEDLVDRKSAITAEALPETRVSAFIQRKVRDCVASTRIPNAEKTVTVRVISDCSKSFKVPEVVRKHFRQPSTSSSVAAAVPPARVNYRSKAITLFQKIDGLDVCIFSMYVQEYNCDDDFEGGIDGKQKKRVYIAYLDSVEHFRPRSCRTQVFREILVAYLATARARGYESAHIWACPPSRGNSFVFWNHPASQRTPTKERLIAWYHGALNRCIESGVVTDVQSLFESSFPLSTSVRTLDASIALSPENMFVRDEGVLDGRMACPPLMEGDFWIEEAIRLHASSIVRHLRSKPSLRELDPKEERCPAVQVAYLLRDRIMPQPVAAPFRRPVNAVSLQLKDYHKVILRPMDLGTVYSRCILGEFDTLQDVVNDVELVFSNAMLYNPKGHSVHELAIEARDLFFRELNALTQKWPAKQGEHHLGVIQGWLYHANVSTSLDNYLEPAMSDFKPFVSSPVDGPVVLSLSVQKPQGDLKIQIPENMSLGPVTPSDLVHHSPSTVTALLPSAESELVSQSPTSVKRSSEAMFALLNSKLELLSGGEDAILKKMVGNDIWIMDKKAPSTPKAVTAKKKAACKRRACPGDLSQIEEPPIQRRRQCWLGEEVGLSVRKMRTSFFTCSLVRTTSMSAEEARKEREYQTYVAPYESANIEDKPLPPSRIADARHAFLEFSQYRNLEFDTLRRAKYSTSILLYHIHYDDAPGLIPSCSSCEQIIQEIRWHRIRRVDERHHTGRVPPTLRAAKLAQISVDPDSAEVSHKGEELCAHCYDKRTAKEEFIPLPVSFKV